MSKNKVAEFLQGEVRRVGITGHVKPDGDCVGAVLAMYHYLRDNYPDVEPEVYLETVPARFLTLPGADVIRTEFDAEVNYDLFFALDAGDLKRIGKSGRYFAAAKKTVCIDHHVSNTGYAQHNVIAPDVGSTCEILYTMMEDEQVGMEAAMCLYMGMAHDTGVFQYANTTPRTMRLAAALMARGFDHTKLIEETFCEKTYVQTQVLGRALMESILVFGGRCVVSVMKRREMEFYGVGPDSMEGIVSQLRMIKGVDLAIFLYEIESQLFRVSMRSNEKIDVSAVAALFGGGGHKRAAGCTIAGDYYDVINNLTLHIQEQMEEAETTLK